MKQGNLFGSEFTQDESEKKYTSKIQAPIYEPKNKQPHLLELVNKEKTKRLINEINEARISPEEKEFLIAAANRHNVFHYERIADYYSHASKEVQNLMERSALVIIDFEKAIQLGYVKLCDDIKSQYLEDYGE